MAITLAGHDIPEVNDLTNKGILNCCEVTQVAHPFGAVGRKVIPVYYDNTANDYLPAIASSLTTLADSILWKVVDADTFDTVMTQTITIPGHGYDVGYWYSLSPTVAGEVVRSDTIPACPDTTIDQKLFFVKSADCLQVNVEPAHVHCNEVVPTASCNIITQITHGFTVGTPVRWDGTQYVAAQATAGNEASFLVTEVIDADTFVVDKNGIISGVAGLLPNTEYALSPTVAGGMVDLFSLTPGTDIIQPLGATTPTGDCFVVQVLPPSEPAAPGGLTVIFTETFNTGAGCGYDNPTGGFETFIQEPWGTPYFHTAGVGDGCAMRQSWPAGTDDGRPHGFKQCFTPEADHIIFEFDWGTDATAPIPATGQMTYVSATNLTGSSFGIRFNMRYDQNTGGAIAIYGFDYNSAGGPVSTFDPFSDGDSGFIPTPGKFYRFRWEFILGVPNASNDVINLMIDELDGTVAAGSTGTVVTNVATVNWTGKNLRPLTSNGFDLFTIGDYVDWVGASTPAAYHWVYDNIKFSR